MDVVMAWTGKRVYHERIKARTMLGEVRVEVTVGILRNRHEHALEISAATNLLKTGGTVGALRRLMLLKLQRLWL
jgi:hypothetical protein